MNPSTTPRFLSSPCLPTEQVRRLVLDIEQLGVDASAIEVKADPALTTGAVSAVDSATMTGAARRTVFGAAVGAVIGIAVAVAVALIAGVTATAAVLVGVLAGLIFGGLYGLYTKTTVSTDVHDAEAVNRSIVDVRTDDLDDETAEKVSALFGLLN